jgi:hypothetical protein
MTIINAAAAVVVLAITLQCLPRNMNIAWDTLEWLNSYLFEDKSPGMLRYVVG